MHLQLYGRKIWIYRSALDFRRSIDGISHFIVNDIKQNPQDGIYLFYNRNKDKIKCLSWHKNGWVLIYKRMEKGKFRFDFRKEQGIMEMNIKELGWLFAGLEWQKMGQWKELNFDKFS